MITDEAKQILLGIYPAELVSTICESLKPTSVYCGRLRHKLYPRPRFALARNDEQIATRSSGTAELTRFKKKCNLGM